MLVPAVPFVNIFVAVVVSSSGSPVVTPSWKFDQNNVVELTTEDMISTSLTFFIYGRITSIAYHI
jgi:hypothetical protein